jgi:alginate O-acetyltransferase complex protein AlgI
MLFISVEFIIFFSIVSTLYFLIPGRGKIPYLLVVSLIFYGYSYPVYALLLLGLAAVDYVLARGIGGSESPGVRSRLLILSLVINVGALVIFKYANFLNDSFASLLNGIGISYQAAEISLLMPLGISFYTFTKIAYIVDVYRGKNKAEANPITFAAFITFFPNVISGPIERAEHLIPQLKQPVKFDYSRTVEGLRLILWGAFKKVVIADQLAIYVNQVYGSPGEYQGVVLMLATFFLAFQIYADFSGYTDMARGIARILGFDLFENFRQPYLSKSILEFWRRWHISLTTWIREYLFFPLSRALLKRTKRRYPRLVEVSAYLVVMSIIGLWHGASWTFVVWGLLHGVYMGVEATLNARRIQILPRNAATDLIKIIFTFLLVTFAWVFFRAETLADAGYILTNMFRFGGDVLSSFNIYASTSGGNAAPILVLFSLIWLLVLVDWIDANHGIFNVLNRIPVIPRWAFYYALIALMVGVLISANTIQNFVYFQF